MAHGGKRERAGRKSLRGTPKIVTTINITPELKAYLSQCKQSQSEVVEDAVRQTKSFIDWMAGQGQ